MAKKSKELKKRPDRKVIEESISQFTLRAMSAYATSVNEDRSVPDLADGLKPVHRRILWAAHGLLSHGQQTKTARVSGEATGRYHPHGSVSVDGAIETLVNSDTPAVEGIGNFGGILDSAAASRYTEVKITKYGHSFTDPDYIAVCDRIKNYDFTTTEPITLPALFPAVFLNSTFGIGVGLTTNIPCFTAQSLIPLCEQILRTGSIPDSKTAAKQLKLNYAGGGVPIKSKDNRKQIEQLLDTGEGSVKWSIDYEPTKKPDEFLLRRFPPGLNFDKFVENIRAIDGVKLVYSGSGLSFIVRLAKNAVEDEVLAKIVKAGTTVLHYKCNVTIRKPIEGDDVKYQTKFLSKGVLELLVRYLKHRVRLEVKSLQWQIAKKNKDIAYTSLLIHACDNLEVIFKALKREDTEDYIAKGLKISLDEAKVILELKVRQLKKLDAQALEKKRKELLQQLKELERRLKKPNISVADAYAAAEFVTNDKRWEHLQQTYLK